ncbi:hypothetical protein [Actinomadura sp. K4S16]|uniref:hypothetical protein n=1 Tax=Actinomadura sp. K4S16 TaxID=1316147 RepID=UPI0011EC7BF0|nr:hypothetical protein [Actinomadura sp. K4S16]
MMPPHCFLCDRSLREGDPASSFTAVRFGINAQEEALEQDRDREGWVGHPSWVAWFCDEHTALAEDHSHLHWREAFELLRQHRRPSGPVK